MDATGATTLVIAIPSADAETVRDIVARADLLGMNSLILPSVEELFGVTPGVADIRPLTEADLLGRHELSLDSDSVAHLPDRQDGAGDRGRRIDRVRAVPSDQPLLTWFTRDART
ncbi:MAG: hypothetical protein M5U19_07030 [Microthrixaceae bacterium]|nr:hypothetical protein [Microthrixaceae bacterium]